MTKEEAERFHTLNQHLEGRYWELRSDLSQRIKIEKLTVEQINNGNWDLIAEISSDSVENTKMSFLTVMLDYVLYLEPKPRQFKKP